MTTDEEINKKRWRIIKIQAMISATLFAFSAGIGIGSILNESALRWILVPTNLAGITAEIGVANSVAIISEVLFWDL